ncbi:amidase [Streptacidiphilus sp. EB103A]|uniref:amidase n=1 Tax=Streptacidiphilus sp. EB103A TaxID=3156275 RepID=UPI003519C72E
MAVPAPHEHTVAGLQCGYRNGEATVSEIVAAYLDRIRAVDPSLNAVTVLNPAALDDAAHLDAAGAPRGPLHGVPVLVKDNIQTSGIETAFGSAALAGYVPAADAHLVTLLRNAGAVILGKTTLPDFAMSWHGHSSFSGITRNPYDLSRDPGGSSSGSAAAVGAGLAVAGVGTDTGGSIRVPASFCGLVGIRPTVGLISRHGVAALVHEQDTPGPLARSVADAAAMLDAMAGWDHRDPATALPVLGRQGGAFRDQLVPGALTGARIGVLRELCETRSGDDPEVARIVEDSLASMREAGAILIDVHLPGLAELLRGTFMYFRQSRRDLGRWLTAAGTPFNDVADIVAAGQSCPVIALLRGVAASQKDPDDGRVTAVQLPSAQDSATHITLALADGSATEAVLWKPPASFDGIAVGDSASIGSVRPGNVMDLRRDATGAVVHAEDYPGYWKAPFVVDGVLAAVVGLPLLAWGVQGLWPRRRGYPFWALFLLPAGVPALLAGGDMWEAPHPLRLGEYLPTVATAAVGLVAGVSLSVWAAHRSDRVKDSSPWLEMPSLK